MLMTSPVIWIQLFLQFSPGPLKDLSSMTLYSLCHFQPMSSQTRKSQYAHCKKTKQKPPPQQKT